MLLLIADIARAVVRRPDHLRAPPFGIVRNWENLPPKSEAHPMLMFKAVVGAQDGVLVANCGGDGLPAVLLGLGTLCDKCQHNAGGRPCTATLSKAQIHNLPILLFLTVWPLSQILSPRKLILR